MRYRIDGGPWPVGDALIPSGAVINTETHLWAKNLVPPINAQALDDVTFAFMQQHYTEKGMAWLMGRPPW